MDTQYLESIINAILKGDVVQNLLSLKQLEEKDFSLEDPDDPSLKPATETKNERCSELSKIVTEVQNIIKEEEKHHFLDPAIDKSLKDSIKELRDIHNKLEENIEGSKTDTGLRNSRLQITDRYKHLKNTMETNFRNHKINNTIFESEKFMHTAPIKELQNRVKEADGITAEIKKYAESVKDIVSSLRDSASAASRKEASGEFAERAKEHRTYAWIWFCASCGFLGLLLIAVIYIVTLWKSNNTDTLELALNIFERLLLITTISVALKICLSKYNSERHLEITYQHRRAALNQYGTFDKAISSDEAKNSLRLALANIIFNDPQTGLVKGDKDLNVSSNFNMTENLSKAAGS